MPETPTPEPGMGCAIYKDRLLPLLRGELKLRMDDLDLAPLLSSAILRIEQLQALLDSHGRETPKAAQFYGAPLDVKVEQGALVVRIGIETLAHAVTYSDWANHYDEATGDYLRSFAITDAPQFASDVAHAMLHEREDGSTPLSDFIDKMSQSAVDDGSLGLHEDFNHRIKHGEKSPLETW